MNENKIGLKSIRELLDKNFFIPNYQRGYRWTTQQVKELLEDIYYFAERTKDEYQFYCMQPLVIREMDLEDKSKHTLPEAESWYEVIDGQQRLTTIYLILHSLNETLKNLNLPTELYKLKFEREANSTCNFISNFSESEICDTNIDYYHLSSAYLFIKGWLKNTQLDMKKFCYALLGSEPDKTIPGRDKANNLRFIWYESVGEDPIRLFTRLNIGKIPLTNSELIKALFLNRTNFNVEKTTNWQLRQKEIASEWDTIEYSLQDNQFWLFLNKKDFDKPSRIEFIFDIICEQNQLGLNDDTYQDIGNDDYKTFRYFFEIFKSGSIDIYQSWKKVKHIYHILNEWYNDLEMYHYIGFIIEFTNNKVKELIEEWTYSEDKATFLKYLKDVIKKIIESCPKLDYQYKIDGSDKGRCKPILLFHNIQTIINNNYTEKNNKKYQLGTFYKFPFHLYKLESWDVEHINSNTTNPEDSIDTQKEWLINIFVITDKDTQKKINEFFATTEEAKKAEIFEEIRTAYPVRDDWSQDEKNRIWNYTLLDSSTNRSYGNAIFSSKRRIIISKDQGEYMPIPQLNRYKNIAPPKKTPCISSFVPQCTKQVFLKYYSATPGDNNYWEISDAEAYLNDIKKCLTSIGIEYNDQKENILESN